MPATGGRPDRSDLRDALGAGYGSFDAPTRAEHAALLAAVQASDDVALRIGRMGSRDGRGPLPLGAAGRIAGARGYSSGQRSFQGRARSNA